MIVRMHHLDRILIRQQAKNKYKIAAQKYLTVKEEVENKLKLKNSQLQKTSRKIHLHSQGLLQKIIHLGG